MDGNKVWYLAQAGQEVNSEYLPNGHVLLRVEDTCSSFTRL